MGIWWLGQDRPVVQRLPHLLEDRVQPRTHTLGLFSKWLREPLNFERWELNLVAYLTRVAENPPNITIDMVLSRAQMLQFLMKLLGWTLRPSVIVPLAEAIASFGEPACSDPHR